MELEYRTQKLPKFSGENLKEKELPNDIVEGGLEDDFVLLSLNGCYFDFFLAKGALN